MTEPTDRDLLLRIAQELKTIRELTSKAVNALHEAESEIPEKMRRFIMYMHDVHDIVNLYHEGGQEAPDHVKREMEHGKLNLRKMRAAKAVKGMLETNVGLIQSEKYLYPIVFKGGTGTNGRKGLKKKMRGDIDDGCMRSIALVINGAKTIKVYFGTPRK